MNCQADIERLAHQKLEAAESLLNDGNPDNAYYIGGYSIELLLKAKVCKTLGIDDFFAFNKGKKELYKVYKVHNYEELLILSGLYSIFNEQLKDLKFKEHWSIVSTWSEEARYLTGKTNQEVNDFVTSIKEICSWIQKHL